VGLGAVGVSADATLATPRPAPSTSIPEAIATAVLIEAATLLLPVIGAANGLPNRVERPPVNNLGGTWQPASSISRSGALDRVEEWSVSS
jgi:hypothetical protein